MHNSFLKLTALAGAIGISCLVILQLQQGPLNSAPPANPAQNPGLPTLQIPPQISPAAPIAPQPVTPPGEQVVTKRPYELPAPEQTSGLSPRVAAELNEPGYRREQQPEQLAQNDDLPDFTEDTPPSFEEESTPSASPQPVTPSAPIKPSPNNQIDLNLFPDPLAEPEPAPAEQPAQPRQPARPQQPLEFEPPLGDWEISPNPQIPQSPPQPPAPAKQPPTPDQAPLSARPFEPAPEARPLPPSRQPLEERPVPEFTPEFTPTESLPETRPPAPQSSVPPRTAEVEPSSYDVPAQPKAPPANPVAPGPKNPQLKIEKIAPPKAVLGEPLIYHIIISNAGKTPATQVVVEDRVPEGTDLTGTIPQAELIVDKLVWKLGTLEPGQQQKISIRVIPRSRGQIGSVATVNFVSEVAAETTVTAPAFQLQLEAPQSAYVGDKVTLTFHMSNTGSGDATGVVLYAQLPEGLSHPEGNDLEFVVGNLKAGETRKVSLGLTASKNGEIPIEAGLKSDGDYSTSAKTALSVVGSRLTLKRIGPRDCYLGRPAVYENQIANGSDAAVPESAIVESIPEGMEFLEASDEGKYFADKRLVVWRLAEIQAGGTKVLKLKLAPQKAGAYECVVKIYEPNGVRTETVSTTTVKGFASLGLDITEAARPIAVGERIPMRIRARNRGTISATNIRVALTIPPEMDVVDIQGPVQHTRNGNQVVFAPVDSLDENKELDFDVVLQARSAGDARLRVQVEGDQLQQPLTNEEAILVIAENQ